MKKQIVRCPFCFEALEVARRAGFELAGVKSCPRRGRGRKGRHSFHWLRDGRTAAPLRLGPGDWV